MDRTSVTPEEKQLREIHQHEAWLRGVCEPAGELDAAAIKTRIRTELAARWLAAEIPSENAALVAARAKAAVRSELGRRRRRRGRRNIFAIGAVGLGLAAAWAVFWVNPLAPILDNPGAPAGFTYVAAFEQFSGGELDAAIDEIVVQTEELDEEIAFVFDDSIGAEFYEDVQDRSDG